MGFPIGDEQRNSLYRHCINQLRGFDDLLNAVDGGDIESAYRLGRKFSDAIRLVQEELGWGDQTPGPFELRTIPEAELRGILDRLRSEAASQYEDARPEQEAFRRPWDEVALIRHMCDEILPMLKSP